MKPAPFDYHDPDTIDEVLSLLAEHGDDAAILAGGQSLIPLLNLRLARPGVVIDLRRVGSLDRIDDDGAGLTIGALVTATAFGARTDLDRFGGAVTEALDQVGHPQIRNRTTIGGSVAHADPAAELPAIALALDGEISLAGTGGERRVAAADFFDGPFSTARRADELLTAVRLADHPGRSTTVEIARRPGDFALAGAVVAVDPARVVLFGVAERPVRLAAVEAEVAAGSSPEAVAEVVRSSVEPRDDVHATGAHRRHLAGTLVARALTSLATAGVPE